MLLLDGPGPAGATLAAANPWFSGRYVIDNADSILAALREHVVLTVIAVGVGLAISLPLALLALRSRQLEGVVLGTAGALYTIPSLALFGLLLPVTGLSRLTVEIALVSYTLLILTRNVMAGLRGVPADVREAARGMGYGPLRQLLRVDLPLALPTIVAGIRVATVSTIALVTVGALVGYGGLGGLILQGLNSLYRAQILFASLLGVALAVTADLALLWVQRRLAPWQAGQRP